MSDPTEADDSVARTSGAPGRLAGKVALVTGAAGRDIGKHVAERLAGEGASVVLLDRSAHRLERMRAAMAAEHGPRISTCLLDLRDRGRIAPAIREVERDVGHVDVLVNNAAITAIGSLVDLEVEAWDEIMQVDLTAPWMLVKAVAPGMMERRAGSIINISSVAAYAAGWREGAYGAAKAALNSLSRDLALELGPFGIRCNVVAPGIVQSKFVADHWELYEDKEAQAALRRFPTPAEVADTVAFLASEESSGLTGAVLNVSAGWYMTP